MEEKPSREEKEGRKEEKKKKDEEGEKERKKKKKKKKKQEKKKREEKQGKTRDGSRGFRLIMSVLRLERPTEGSRRPPVQYSN